MPDDTVSNCSTVDLTSMTRDTDADPLRSSRFSCDTVVPGVKSSDAKLTETVQSSKITLVNDAPYESVQNTGFPQKSTEENGDSAAAASSPPSGLAETDLEPTCFGSVKSKASATLDFMVRNGLCSPEVVCLLGVAPCVVGCVYCLEHQ